MSHFDRVYPIIDQYDDNNDTKWKEIQKYYFKETICSNALAINKTEYIISTENNIYKYNNNSNEWSKYISYPKNYKVKKYCCLTYNKRNKIIYVLNGFGELIKLNYKRKNRKLEYSVYSLSAYTLADNSYSCLFILAF